MGVSTQTVRVDTRADMPAKAAPRQGQTTERAGTPTVAVDSYSRTANEPKSKREAKPVWPVLNGTIKVGAGLATLNIARTIFPVSRALGGGAALFGGLAILAGVDKWKGQSSKLDGWRDHISNGALLAGMTLLTAASRVLPQGSLIAKAAFALGSATVISGAKDKFDEVMSPGGR